jgi:Dna[CI] antecedent, DciA
MTARKINFYLGSLRLTPEHQRLFSYTDKLTAMQQVFMKIAPPQLAQRSALGAFVEGDLTIYARNGAIAAKLRQMLPSLLLKFRARGYEVTAIRIAVQANYHSTIEPDVTVKTRQMGRAGVESLGKLVVALPPSPLRTAVARLLKRQAKSQE